MTNRIGAESDNTHPRRWQLNIRSPQAGIAHICKEGLFIDCQFTVGVKTFNGHRLILAARSPLFAKMLKMNDIDPAKQPAVTKINITDVSEDAFEILFNYIYTNKVGPMDTEEKVLDVFSTAFKYSQKGLKDACEKIILGWEITCNNVIRLIQMSSVAILRNKCLDFLRRHAIDVLKSDGILEAWSDTVAFLFERGYLTGASSLELLSNVLRWAEYQLPKMADYTPIRDHLLMPCGAMSKSLMSWIGFHKLTTTELGQVIADYPNLLSDEEVRILFQYSIAAQDKKPDLPVW